MVFSCHVLILFYGFHQIFHNYVVASAVTETSKSYDCTDEEQNLTYIHANNFVDCQQEWSFGTHVQQPIAKYANGNAECYTPCREVTPGRIVVDACINVTLTIFCEKEYVTEHRIHFHGKTKINPSPIRNSSSKHRARYGILACLLLFVAAVALGFIFHYLRSSQ